MWQQSHDTYRIILRKKVLEIEIAGQLEASKHESR